jgi:carbonic anhydrase/acetyltransferase-like protein (isoleucine patch superfamily)
MEQKSPSEKQILKLGKYVPQIGKNNFFADGSILVGRVRTGENCSFWFHAVVRGDVHEIELGNDVNVQDGAIIHCTYKKASTKIGNKVSIGHRAIVHGCKIEDRVLIGMGAIVMDHAEIGEGALIAAGAVVLSGTKIPPFTLWAGVPAKQIRTLDFAEVSALHDQTAENYIRYANWYREDQTPD